MFEKKKFGSKQVYPLGIPSGLVTTEPQTLERLLNVVPDLGFATSKSITLNPRPMAKTIPAGPDEGNREDIIYQYAPGCYINNVGLINPGVEEFKAKAKTLSIPQDKAFLVSIAGRTLEEFVETAKSLEEVEIVDAIELNKSCPHTEKYGMQIGQDAGLVHAITKAVVAAVSKPVFVKLANVQNIGEIAKAAISAGAYGITAINTVGPGIYMFDGHYVLSNKTGGLSGRGILPIGLKCVKEIREAIGSGPRIIACGGIATADDVRAYAAFDADFFCTGSGALADMDEAGLINYFKTLLSDLRNGTNYSKSLVSAEMKSYAKHKVMHCEQLANDFHLLELNGSIPVAKPGQFVFLWLPGVGAKPFSILDDDPFTIAFSERGCFTKALARLQAGSTLYVRGPYGKSPQIPYYRISSKNDDVVLVGGGTGIAGLYLFAKTLPHRLEVFLGAKSAGHIPYLKEFAGFGDVHVATEDGSMGHHGLVTELFGQYDFDAGTYFINCGPRAMVERLVEMQLKFSPPQRIYSSIEYPTSCGRGLCGRCANPQGKRTCIEGPFMQAEI